MTTTNPRKTLLTLPSDVVSAFNSTSESDIRDSYIVALRDKGWTLQSIAAATGVSRERIRQIVKNTEVVAIPSTWPIPDVPAKAVKAPPVYVEPTADTLARLLELQEDAQKVRANSPKFREAGEEYTKLVNYAHTVEGVTLYRLAKRLGVSHGALRFRLARYGYKQPVNGSSKVYAPIKSENRVGNRTALGPAVPPTVPSERVTDKSLSDFRSGK